MDIKETLFSGCFLITPPFFEDQRGHLTKTLHADCYQKAGIHFDVKEEYYSISQQNVLRGLHIQQAPKACGKLVYCAQGKIFDVIVDLRVDSPTFGQAQSFILSSTNREVLFMPAGIAHGFYAYEDMTLVICKTSEVYSPQNEAGILWSSVPITWPTSTPLLSEKDMQLPTLSEVATTLSRNN